MDLVDYFSHDFDVLIEYADAIGVREDPQRELDAVLGTGHTLLITEEHSKKGDILVRLLTVVRRGSVVSPNLRGQDVVLR